jgi:hypothetical protein
MICKVSNYQILHLDLDIQYSLKITKSQELVKFAKSFQLFYRFNFYEKRNGLRKSHQPVGASGDHRPKICQNHMENGPFINDL